MTHLAIQEEVFNKKSTESYELSILLGVDSFVYCICDQQHRLLVLRTASYGQPVGDFSKLPAPLQQLVEEDPLLALPYARARVGVIDHRFTLIPDQLYRDREQASYLSKICPIQKDQLIRVDRLEPLGARNVYLVHGDVNRVLRQYYPNLELFNAMSALLLGLHQGVGSSDGPRLYGNIRGQVVQLAYFDGPELVFSNSFPFLSSKDFIYFVMNVFHQFELSPAEVPFVLSGQIVRDSEIFQLVYRYIQNVEFAALPNSIALGEEANKHSPHFYFDLFSLAACE